MIDRRHLSEVAECGYSVIENLVFQSEIDEFEQAISDVTAAFVDSLPHGAETSEPFANLLAANDADRDLLHAMLERHFILHTISARLCDDFRASGFFDWTGIKVPLVWPHLRVDLPLGSGNLLPVHQDYSSTRCRTAYRLWIPLRDANEHAGTMSLYPGTHRGGPVAHDLDDPARPQINPRHYAGRQRFVLDLSKGHGVLIDPMVFHASVPNQSTRTKFTLMIQIQDLATLIPADDDRYADFARARAAREAVRG